MKIKGDINEILKSYRMDPYRKSYLRTSYEVLRCMIEEKELPIYYFTHLLFKKDATNYLDYIGHKRLRRIINEVFKPNEILDDKELFQKFIQENNIAGPVQLAYIEKGIVIYPDSLPKEELKHSKDVSFLLERLLSSAASGSVFIKPVDGIGGYGTYKIKQEDLTNSDLIDSLFTELSRASFIIQKTIVQHELMANLNNSSINTIRIHTYRTPDGGIEVSSALCRMGHGGAFVDNGSSGGLFVPVDLKTGRLEKHAYNYMANGGKTFVAHPDTGITYEGYELPFFHDSLKLAIHVASFFDNVIIGWDIAITKDGPIVIEGNYNPHIVMAQTACKGFRNHPIYKEFFKAYIT